MPRQLALPFELDYEEEAKRADRAALQVGLWIVCDVFVGIPLSMFIMIAFIDGVSRLFQ